MTEITLLSPLILPEFHITTFWVSLLQKINQCKLLRLQNIKIHFLFVLSRIPLTLRNINYKEVRVCHWENVQKWGGEQLNVWNNNWEILRKIHPDFEGRYSAHLATSQDGHSNQSFSSTGQCLAGKKVSLNRCPSKLSPKKIILNNWYHINMHELNKSIDSVATLRPPFIGWAFASRK